MKKIILPGLLMFVFAACKHGGTTVTITENESNMRIIVEDYEINPIVEFKADYNIAGMDSAQRKALSKRVLDSIGHGRYD